MGRLRNVIASPTRRWWVIAFVIATLWVWQRYAVVQAGHRIAEQRAVLAELVEIRDALLAENTTLSARNRIESIAVSRLGLGPTGKDQMVWLQQDQLEETPSAALANSVPSGIEEAESISEPVVETDSDPANP